MAVNASTKARDTKIAAAVNVAVNTRVKVAL